MSKNTILFILLFLMASCTPENEHFCARYAYVFDQLSEPGLPSYNEMKQQLVKEIEEKPSVADKSGFMLFVLEDYHLEIKPDHLKAKQFCMESKRWLYFN
jgi:hypothetical protein